MNSNTPDAPEPHSGEARPSMPMNASAAQDPEDREERRHALGRRSSVLRRSLVLCGISVGLCLPLLLIWLTIAGRSHRAEEAEREIRSSWGNDSLLAGPFLVVPYSVPNSGSNGNGWIGPADQRRRPSSSSGRGWVVLIASELKVDAEVIPEKRSRGLFDSTVFKAQAKISGAFNLSQLSQAKLPAEAELRWSEAFVSVLLHDLRGIERPLALQTDGGASSVFQPVPALRGELREVRAQMPLESTSTSLRVALEIPLRGGGEFAIAPTAQQADIVIRSPWPDPRFFGASLPDKRQVSRTGFEAVWRFSGYSLTLPTVQVSDVSGPLVSLEVLRSLSVGAKIEPAVGPQRMAERAVKYGFLFVGALLGILFVFEVQDRVRFRGVHYLLVGLAACLFFLLLLALHEMVPFPIAYVVAALVCSGMIVAFCRRLLKGRDVFYLSVSLVGSFSYLFVVMKLEDYALLAGTAALFFALGVAMRLVHRPASDTHGTPVSP